MHQWPHFNIPNTKYITLRYEIWTATESEMSNGDSPADDLSAEAADYRTKVSFVHGKNTYHSAFTR